MVRPAGQLRGFGFDFLMNGRALVSAHHTRPWCVVSMNHPESGSWGLGLLNDDVQSLLDWLTYVDMSLELWRKKLVCVLIGRQPPNGFWIGFGLFSFFQGVFGSSLFKYTPKSESHRLGHSTGLPCMFVVNWQVLQFHHTTILLPLGLPGSFNTSDGPTWTLSSACGHSCMNTMDQRKNNT